MMNKYTNVRMLIPVWGARYIDDFVKFSLPSILADGNIPFMAERCRVTVVFLTARKNFQYFKKQRMINNELSRYCAIEFIPIDDLISRASSYSVPLTLAYLRGMTDTGEEMTRTHFFYFNSDFVLAVGSLKKATEYILDGRSVILAPSFRVNSGPVKSYLNGHLAESCGRFSIKPRDMVRLAFSHMHPTVVARIVNQRMFHSYYPNQIYWQADKDTLLARFYLIMQICIRPERRVDSINNFVDYAFLPEMCPSGDIAAITDSDDFFMMELQHPETEKEFVQSGPAKAGHVARSLSDWATYSHRDIGRFELLFHSGELPVSLPAQRVLFNDFMSAVERRLSPKPVPHDRHHYWPGAVDAWIHRAHRNRKPYPGGAQESDSVSQKYFSGLRYQLCPPSLSYYLRIRRWKILFLSIFWGLPPNVRPWHPQWFNFLCIKYALAGVISGKDCRILYVTTETDMDGFFKRTDSVVKILPRDLLGGFIDRCAGHGDYYSACFIHLTEADAHLAQEIARYVIDNIAITGKIIIYIGQCLVDSGLLTIRYTTLSMLVSGLNNSYDGALAYRFTGGFVWQRSAGLFSRIFVKNEDDGLLGNLVLGMRMMVGSVLMLFANSLAFISPRKDAVPVGCSGMIARVDPAKVKVGLPKRSSAAKRDYPVVAVFGSRGFIGRNLMDEFLRKNPLSVGICKDAVRGELLMDLSNPDIHPLELRKRGVTHAVIAAAVSTIAECERDPAFTRSVNVYGTAELARQLCESGIRVMALSSDYVFDGAQGGYGESSPVLPVNEYGRQKAEMEKLLSKICRGNILILRFSKVYDMTRGSGTLLDEMVDIMLRGGTVRAAYDQLFCPTYIGDIVDIAGSLLVSGANGIFHVCSPERISRFDIARRVTEIFGTDEKFVRKISLKELGEGFARPLDTSMVSERLDSYLKHDFKDLNYCIRGLKKSYTG